MPLLFLYGTLKRGGSNHAHMEGQRFCGTARTPAGWRLYQLDGYPGMVPVAGDLNGVEGEIWEVSREALERLDQFEGVPEGLYRRECIRVLPEGFGDAVETYVYAGSVQGRRDLGSVWLG